MFEIAEKINFNLFHDVESKVQHYEYSAFGKILSIKDGNGNDVTGAPAVDQRFSYTGREWDNESGLYYYRARSYDPNIGRFLQIDPDAGRLSTPISHINKYSYVGNNPVISVDPTGMSKINFGDVVGFAMGGGLAYVLYRDQIRHWATQHRSEIIAVTIITAAVAISLATGGSASAVLVPALLGGTANGAFGKGGTSRERFFEGASVGAVGGLVGGNVSGWFTNGLTAESSALAVISANVAGGIAGGIAGVNVGELVVNQRLATKGENTIAASTGFLFGLGSAIKTIIGTSVIQGQGTGVSALPSNDSPSTATAPAGGSHCYVDSSGGRYNVSCP
jgi:RHS repeat-associated protein